MIKKFSSRYGSCATALAIPLVPTGASWTHSTLCTLFVINLIWTFILVIPLVVTLLPHICHILHPSRPPPSVHLNNIQQTVHIKIPLNMPLPPSSCHFPLHSDIHSGTSILKCTQLVSFPSPSSQSFILIWTTRQNQSWYILRSRQEL